MPGTFDGPYVRAQAPVHLHHAKQLHRELHEARLSLEDVRFRDGLRGVPGTSSAWFRQDLANEPFTPATTPRHAGNGRLSLAPAV